MIISVGAHDEKSNVHSWLYMKIVHCFQGGGALFQPTFFCLRLNNGSVITPTALRNIFPSLKRVGTYVCEEEKDCQDGWWLKAKPKSPYTLSKTSTPARRTLTAAVYGFKMAPKTSRISFCVKTKKNMWDTAWCFLRLTEPEDELCFETSSLSSMILQTQRRAFETKHTRPHQRFHLTFLTFHYNEARKQKIVFFPQKTGLLW